MKDCQSFLEMIDKIDQLSQKRMDCETLIRDYEVEIDELAMGKSTVSSMTTRKSKEEVKRIIEDKKSKCIVEKHNYMMLTDMVTILIAYLEVDTYRVLLFVIVETEENILHWDGQKNSSSRGLCIFNPSENDGRHWKQHPADGHSDELTLSSDIIVNFIYYRIIKLLAEAVLSGFETVYSN